MQFKRKLTTLRHYLYNGTRVRMTLFTILFKIIILSGE